MKHLKCTFLAAGLLTSSANAVVVITDLNTSIDWTVLDDENMNDTNGNVVRTGTWQRNVVGSNAFNGIEYRATATATPGTPTETATWTFLNLTSGTYEVAVSWTGSGGGRATNSPFSINGGTTIPVSQTSASSGSPGLVDLSGAGGANQINYLVLSSNTTVGASGQLTVLLTNDANGTVYNDSIAIRLVPEPSSTALLGLGGLALILRRRRF